MVCEKDASFAIKFVELPTSNIVDNIAVSKELFNIASKIPITAEKNDMYAAINKDDLPAF